MEIHNKGLGPDFFYWETVTDSASIRSGEESS